MVAPFRNFDVGKMRWGVVKFSGSVVRQQFRNLCAVNFPFAPRQNFLCNAHDIRLIVDANKSIYLRHCVTQLLSIPLRETARHDDFLSAWVLPFFPSASVCQGSIDSFLLRGVDERTCVHEKQFRFVCSYLFVSGRQQPIRHELRINKILGTPQRINGKRLAHEPMVPYRYGNEKRRFPPLPESLQSHALCYFCCSSLSIGVA